MLQDVTRLFKKKGQKQDVEIEALMDMRVTTADGVNRSVIAGEIVHVNWETYRALEPDQRRVITDVAALPPPWQCPARPEPLPAPERLRSLPPEFVVFWDVEEKIRVARAHVTIIQDERLKAFGTASYLPSQGTALAGGVGFSRDTRDGNLYSTLTPHDMSNPVTARLDRLLTAAEDGAVDFLHRLWNLHDVPQQQRHYDAGRLYIAGCVALNDVLTELGTIGYQIFRLRVLALGLTEHKNKELFCGSLDFHRFNHPQTSAWGTVSGGYGEDGILRVYSEESMETLATLMLSNNARLTAMTQLLANAKVELQRATAAAMPPGLPA